LLFVDNNCTNTTQQVLRKSRKRLPLRTVLEKQTGVSHARNRVIDCSDGDRVIWTDDDVRVSQQWLNTYARAAQRHTMTAFFGGPIDVRFDEQVPRWLRSVMPFVETNYGKIDLGPEEHALDAAMPFGANFAVRNEILQQYRFDTSLGRC
jgi:glycosyltransferase involved in cell wall biosynthesis